MHCNYCNVGDSEVGSNSRKCCWAQALEIHKFRRSVWKKFIVHVLFDMIISVTSVVTDIVAIILYLVKGKITFALFTAIPVLLPTFVFTNVYLRDDKDVKMKSKHISVIASVSGTPAEYPSPKTTGETSDYLKRDFHERNFSETGESEDGDTGSIERREVVARESQCQKNIAYNFSCCTEAIVSWWNFSIGCLQCFCNCDADLRRKGAEAAKNSFQKALKYGFGTFVLRFIAWSWYIKAFIYGLKAYKEPKRYLKIETPDHHWSYQLLIRLDFLQAALENAPQCCIQLYALMTQPDEDVALGLLTLIISFIDFIRISVSIHWDMNKGPVTAPPGCYHTTIWKCINTFSWIFIYSGRSAALALIFAISGFKDLTVLLPIIVLTIHIIVLSQMLSKAEYGVAAQKIFVATFISVFFLPELDSSVLPAIIQFYYAFIIVQNAFFILPWKGFGKEFCVATGSWDAKQNQYEQTSQYDMTPPTTIIPPKPKCLIDPTFITIAVPTITILGAIFRLVSSQRMVQYKKTLSMEERDITQNRMETSIANIFSKKWSTMSVNEMFSAFVKMLKKEVIISNPENNHSPLSIVGEGKKKMSFMSSALQAEFFASQTHIRESFSLITRRSTRSDDLNIENLMNENFQGIFDNEEPSPPHYNSDSELTLRNSQIKKRSRLSTSLNNSENVHTSNETENSTFIEVDMTSGSQLLEMCWI